jgi:hypothetical protein
MEHFDPSKLELGDVLGGANTVLWEDTADCTTWLKRESDDQIRVIKEWKNVGALLAANAREAAEWSKSQGLSSMAKVASIPVGLWSQWDAEGITDDPVAMARRLNDPDYAKLKTKNINI